MTPSKTLSNVINSQHFSVSEDAELSIVKVAQLEKVQFHNHHHQQQHQQSIQKNRIYEFFGDSKAPVHRGGPLVLRGSAWLYVAVVVLLSWMDLERWRSSLSLYIFESVFQPI